MTTTAEHEPCPRCGKQPVATKGKTYWTARCETEHLFPVKSCPMPTKTRALAAWDDDVKHKRIGS